MIKEWGQIFSRWKLVSLQFVLGYSCLAELLLHVGDWNQAGFLIAEVHFKCPWLALLYVFIMFSHSLAMRNCISTIDFFSIFKEKWLAWL